MRRNAEECGNDKKRQVMQRQSRLYNNRMVRGWRPTAFCPFSSRSRQPAQQASRSPSAHDLSPPHHHGGFRQTPPAPHEADRQPTAGFGGHLRDFEIDNVFCFYFSTAADKYQFGGSRVYLARALSSQPPEMRPLSPNPRASRRRLCCV